MGTVKKTTSVEKNAAKTPLSVVKGKENESSTEQSDLQKQLEALEAKNKALEAEQKQKESALKKAQTECKRVEEELNKRKGAKVEDVLVKTEIATTPREAQRVKRVYLFIARYA